MARIKIGIVAVLAAIVVIVILQNTAEVETKFLVVSIKMPRAFLIGLTFLMGAVSGLLLATRIGSKKKKD